MPALTIELDERTLAMLSALGEPREVLAQLADHAQQGVYRPGSWERDWLLQAFGPEFLGRLERDPEAPAPTLWMRPRAER